MNLLKNDLEQKKKQLKYLERRNNTLGRKEGWATHYEREHIKKLKKEIIELKLRSK